MERSKDNTKYIKESRNDRPIQDVTNNSGLHIYLYTYTLKSLLLEGVDELPNLIKPNKYNMHN